MVNPTLAEVQRLLSKLVTAPEGVAAGLDALSAPELAAWAELLRGDDRLSTVERLDIYANMYFYRLRDSLAEDFPTVAAVIGADRFHNLVTDYLLAHPPSHFSLRYAGQHLPNFVATHAVTGGFPYLADLAGLEWAVLEAFDAADAEPLDRASLSTVPAEAWGELSFRLTPSLRVLRLTWPVQQLWLRAQAGEPLGVVESAPTWLRVWRDDLRVYQRTITFAEQVALATLQAGATFAEMCEGVVSHTSPDTAPEDAATMLAAWFADGLVTGVLP